MPILDKENASKVKEYEEFVKNSPFTHAMQAPAWAKVKNNWMTKTYIIQKINF